MLDGLPFSLMSFKDDIDPIPGVRDGRTAAVLGEGFDPATGGFEMDRFLLGGPVMEALGRGGGLTVSGPGEGTREVLDGGLLIAEAGGFETDGERAGLIPVDDDNAFLSAVGWTLDGRTEVLRAWVGAGGLAGGIAVLVVGVDVFFTGETVGEGLIPGVLTLERVGLPTPTIWKHRRIERQ